MRKTDILDVSSRKLAPYMFLFGLYLVTFGDVSPGGGFQGGAVIASGVILLAMAKGADAAAALFPTRALALVEAITFAVILAVGIAGIVIAGAFLADFMSGSRSIVGTPFIFALNVLIGVKVAAGISIICLHIFEEV